MELNRIFINGLQQKTRRLLFVKFLELVERDEYMKDVGLAGLLVSYRNSRDEFMLSNNDSFWHGLVLSLTNVDRSVVKHLKENYVEAAKRTDRTIGQIVDYAKQSYLYGKRCESDLVRDDFPGMDD